MARDVSTPSTDQMIALSDSSANARRKIFSAALPTSVKNFYHSCEESDPVSCPHYFLARKDPKIFGRTQAWASKRMFFSLYLNSKIFSVVRISR